MSNAYKVMPAFILDQLFSYQDANIFKHNVEIAVSGFRLPDEYDSPYLQGLYIGDTSTQGYVYFNGGTSFYITAVDDDLEIHVDDDEKLDLNGYYIIGERVVMSSQGYIAASTIYGSMNDTSRYGWVIPKDCSVTGLSLAVYTNSGLSGTCKLSAEIYSLDASAVVVESAQTGNLSASSNDGVHASYARGTYSLNEGDSIEIGHKFDDISGGASADAYSSIFLELTLEE